MIKMKELTGVILYRDEQEYLPKVIENIYPHVDRLILCDDQSKDVSAFIARSFSDSSKKILNVVLPKILSDRYGFGDKKNFALSFVESAWILLLDVDEIIEAWRRFLPARVVVELGALIETEGEIVVRADPLGRVDRA